MFLMSNIFLAFLVCFVCECAYVEGIASFLEKPIHGRDENDTLKKKYYFAMLNQLSGEAEFPEEINSRQPCGNIFYVRDDDTEQCYIYYPQQMDFSPSEITLHVVNCSTMMNVGEYHFSPSVFSRTPPTPVILDTGNYGKTIYGVIGNNLVQVSINSTSKKANHSMLASIMDANCDFVADAVFADEQYFVMCGSGTTYDSSYFMVFDSTTWGRKSSFIMNDIMIQGIEYFQGKMYGVYNNDKGQYYFGYFDTKYPATSMTSLISFDNIYGFLGVAIHSNMFYAIISGTPGEPPFDLGYYFFVFDLLKGKQFMFQRIFDQQDYRYDVGMYMKYIYYYS